MGWTSRDLFQMVWQRRSIVFAIVVVLVGLVVVWRQTAAKTYEATATFAVQRPRVLARFDDRLLNQTPVAPTRILVAATVRSALVERQVMDILGSRLTDAERIPGALIETINLAQRGDPSVYELNVRSSDPIKAQLIANTWAEVYAKVSNQLLDQTGESQVTLEKQLTEARTRLAIAEENLIKFQREHNQMILIQKRIEALTAIVGSAVNTRAERYRELLGTRKNIRLVRQDAEKLREQIRSSPDGLAPNSSLASLLLQLQSMMSTQSETNPVQLQVPLANLQAAVSRQDQLRQLDGLVRALSDEETALNAAITDTGRVLIDAKGNPTNSLDDPAVAMQAIQAMEELQQLQARLQTESNEWSNLQREYDLAKELVKTLANKLEEVRLDNTLRGSDVRVLSPAPVPYSHIGVSLSLAVMFATVVGLVVGCLAALAVELISQPGTTTTTSVRPVASSPEPVGGG